MTSTSKQEIDVDVSPEQEDAIVDHVFHGKQLGMPPDERAWMLSQARKKLPGCKILAADLDIKTLKWYLTVEVPT